jgi:hypothetical protein
MDEQLDRKIRDLKLKIFMAEKELTASQHTMKLGALLRAGHAGQINKNALRDRERLEKKLDDLRAKLADIETGAVKIEASEPEPEPQTIKKGTKKATTAKPAAAKKAK